MFRRTALLLFVCIAVLVMLAVQPVTAFELPSNGTQPFIQTSGPNAGLTVGDFYTSVGGDNSFHEVQVYVPCTWNPALPITFAIFDPESADPDSAAAPFVIDEVRNGSDDTTFTLIAPGGTTIGPRVFTGAGGTNLLWVELATINIGTAGFGCGVYTIRTTASDDDDNAWRLSAANDPDCTLSPGTCSVVGAASSILMDNGNENDDADGIVGSGDELFTSFTRLSLQHFSQSCQPFFLFIDGTVSPVTLNNFDMDDPGGGNGNISITYFPPAGSQYAPSVVGTESGQSSWNGSANNPANNPNPPRTGDSFVIAAQDIGWWRTDICVNANNQYIFEGQEGTPLFFEQPPYPIMTISKDDGQTTVSGDGQQVTYTINYANINPVGAPNFGGAALNTVITDTLPAGATFVSCSAGCTPAGGTVTWNIGTVPAPPVAGNSGSVTVTVNLPPAAAGSTHTNTVSMDFTDITGINYAPVTATDIDNVIAGTGTPVIPPTSGTGGTTVGAASAGSLGGLNIRKSVNLPFAAPGDSVTYTIIVTNSSGSAASNVSVTDTLPVNISATGGSATSGAITVNGQTVTLSGASVAAGGSVTITINARISASASVPFVLVNNACFSGTDVCAQASIISASSLPQTGETPWWAVLRFWLFGGMAGLVYAGGTRVTGKSARR